MDLKIFKKEYEKLEKKYELPKFESINKDFEIEKFERESDFILKTVRKIMMEKIVNSMGFLEMLLNPVNSPRMYLPFIRTMSSEDKTNIDKLYEAFANLSLLSLDLEVDSEEKKEAELIKIVFNKWIGLKPIFKELITKIKEPKNFVKRERSYFG